MKATPLLVSAAITNGALTKTGAGAFALSGANTYTGQTTVSAGILKVDNDGTATFGKITGSNATPDSILVNSGGTLLLSGAGDHIADTTTLTLAGGTFDAGGVSETLGTLTLTEDSTIDFGGGASTLTFADSTGLWTANKTLSIWNWSGVVVNGGADTIKSTMILPETESRELAVISGTTLLELGINGLLAASIGSHLGPTEELNR